jgi:hypothetical protein
MMTMGQGLTLEAKLELLLEDEDVARGLRSTQRLATAEKVTSASEVDQ